MTAIQPPCYIAFSYLTHCLRAGKVYPIAPSSPIELSRFVAAAKEKGASDEAVVSILEDAGWSRNEVWRVLGQHYESLTGITVPAGTKSTTPAKDAFLYLLSFATLATWTLSLGSICYALIDDWIKDPLSPNSYHPNLTYQISEQLAALIVTFPLYIFVMKVIISDTRQAPAKLESGVRKWLTYIALFIAACVMVGDIVTFLAYFLRGELTGRFVAKVSVTLAIAGGVFWYYLGSLREARKVMGHAAQ
jgi:hypothetical protein